MDIQALIISVLLGGVGVWLVSRFVGGFRLRGGFFAAMLVGGVYGLLKFLLGGVLIVLSLPLVILTLGLFIVVINAFLLWLTDKLMSRLEIRSAGSLLLATVLLSLLDIAFGIFIGYSAPY